MPWMYQLYLNEKTEPLKMLSRCCLHWSMSHSHSTAHGIGTEFFFWKAYKNNKQRVLNNNGLYKPKNSLYDKCRV